MILFSNPQIFLHFKSSSFSFCPCWVVNTRICIHQYIRVLNESITTWEQSWLSTQICIQCGDPQRSSWVGDITKVRLHLKKKQCNPPWLPRWYFFFRETTWVRTKTSQRRYYAFPCFWHRYKVAMLDVHNKSGLIFRLQHVVVWLEKKGSLCELS